MYLSDEYARLNRNGDVHPHPRPLSIRSADRNRVTCTAADLGARTEKAPLPIGTILLTAYQPDAVWKPRRLGAAHALVRMMSHTVAARRDPAFSMPILKVAVMQAVALESMRPEADVVVRSVLS